MGVLTNYYENKDLSNVTSLDRIFEEEPVGLDVFIKDSKFLGMDGDGLSPIQMEFVQYSERVYKRDMYPLLAAEFGGYWAETKDVRMTNLISAEWGKGCLLAGEEIYDASTGQWVAVEDAQEGTTAAVTEGNAVTVRPRTSSFLRGRGESFKVTTATGLTVKVFAGHKFLTEDGYVQLRNLAVGDKIAQVTKLPIQNPQPLDSREVELVGWWLGDGIMPSGRSGLTMMFSDNEAESMARYVEVCASLGVELTFRRREGKKCWYVNSTRNSGYKKQNPLMEIARRYGLRGKTAHNVRVPKPIFSLPDDQVALFLARLWTTDGHVYASKSKNTPSEAGYVSVSEEMVRDVQRLLLRLGISSEIRSRLVSGYNVTTTAWEVRLRTGDDLRAFCTKIPLLDKWKSQNAVVDNLNTRLVRKARYRDGDLRYTKIASIEPLGDHDYYDLTVDVDHNYIAAGGLVNHNSGKDMCSRIISLRIAYLLMCLRSPQEYFGMPGADSIHMLNIAANAPQAQRAFFEPMTRAVKTGWFADKAEPKKSSIAYAKNLEAISGHSSVDGQEGLNLILGVADEIDAFKTRTEMVGLGRRSREASTSAESILDMLKTSASAQPLDAKVLTPTGWKLMGDIAVGDKVVDPKGDTTSEVTGIYPQGVTPVYEVKFADGTSTRASHHHLWQVEYLWSPTTVEARKSCSTEMVERTVTTEWLVENLPKYQKWGRAIRVVEGNLHETDFKDTDFIVHPYLLGALLGDGGLTHCTPTFTSAEEAMFDNVRRVLPEGISMSDRIEHVGCSSVRLIHGKGKSNPLTVELDRLGVWGKQSYDKHIPDEYKWTTAENRVALLQGLLDTDGSADAKTGIATFSSTSHQLAYDVAQLARSLSLGARIIGPRDNTSPEGDRIQSRRPYYTVTINKYKDVELFKLERKAVRTEKVKTRRFAHAITEITRLEDAETQCIKVSAESELYYTDDFIVTHNTRFPEVYKQVTISFPRYKNSKIQQLTAQGKESNAKYGRDSNYYVSGPHATWVVNPLRKQEDFKMDYLQNPVEAAAKYECKPAESSNPYFRDVVPFVEAEDRDEEPITVNYELVNSISEVNGNDVQQWEAVFTFADWFKPVPGALYAMHGDLAVNGDRAGVAMSHVVDWVEKEVTFINDNHLIETSKESLPVVRNDFTIGFEADIGSQPAREIQIRWARQLAYALIQRGFTVALFTFDGFQSVDSMQLLEASGIETDRVSTDLNNNVWRTLRDVASDRRLKRPKNELLLTELKSLVDLGRKVDHPPNGGKDLADAFACSIVGAITLGGSESEDHEDIQVGGSIFETQNQMGGLARPEEFGISLGSMLPIGMTLEAPFGTN